MKAILSTIWFFTGGAWFGLFERDYETGNGAGIIWKLICLIICAVHVCLAVGFGIGFGLWKLFS